MKILREKLFNSKDTKRFRRFNDYLTGEKRLKAVDPTSAEAAYLHGKARYPGETVNSVYREGNNFRIKSNLRRGVNNEKANRLTKNIEELAVQDPNRYAFHKRLVAGRDTQSSAVHGFTEDLSNLNQRINARGLGTDTITDELKRRKKISVDPSIKNNKTQSGAKLKGGSNKPKVDTRNIPSTVPSTPVKPTIAQQSGTKSGIKAGIKAGTWVKNNRMAIAGTALATAAAIGAYKHYKNKKKNSEDNK